MFSERNKEELSLFMQLKSKGKSCIRLFEDCHIKDIAIYGAGELGKLMYDEFTQSGIHVKYFIDKQPADNSPIAIRHPSTIGNCTDVDAIVVCIDTSFILHHRFVDKLISKTSAKIYSLMDVLMSAYYSEVALPFLKELYRSKGVESYFYHYPFLSALSHLSNTEKVLDGILNNTLRDLTSQPLYFDFIYHDVDEYSSAYIEEVFTGVPVIKTKIGYQHSNVKRKYLNVVNNQRLTTDTPENYERTFHLFGTCTMFGYGVDDSRTISSHLQRILNDSEKDNGYRVINYGVCGGCYDLLSLEKMSLIDYTPNDVIVFQNHVFTASHADKRPYFIDYMNRLFEQSDCFYFTCFDQFNEKHTENYLLFDFEHLTHHGSRLVADCIYKAFSKSLNIKNIVKPENETNHQRHIQKAEPISYENSELGEYIKYLTDERIDAAGKIGAIVVNCNPFTNGHRFLIEQSLKEVDFLYVFVVEEDKSIFPFKDRLNLVKEGTADLKNVKVLTSGKFIISSLTFPAYFVKESQSQVYVDTSVDIELFANKVAPALNISKRFVGEEPLCQITRQYNHSMRNILPKYGIELKVFGRIDFSDEPISASKVRRLLQEHNYEEIKSIVPASTYNYLKSMNFEHLVNSGAQ